MNSEVMSYCQYCTKCGSYYIDAIGETCRCPHHETEEEVLKAHVELLSKWQVGDVTL
jgi:hypothetical protein